MATLHDGAPIALTVEYLKNSYAPLQYVLDNHLASILEQLESEWITTTTHLENVTRDTLLTKGFPAVFVDAVKPGGLFVQPQLQAAAEVDDDLVRMMNFFNNTNVAELTFSANDSYWLDHIEMLSWSRERLHGFYWRFCYSYITCSTVAGFEDAHASGRILSMVLTGSQGTGKSVLGAFIALVMSKVFGWRVTYKWGSKSVSFGGDVALGKKITVFDLSAGDSEINVGSEYALIISSGNDRRWHKLSQQESWSSAKGNFIFIDPVPRQELSDMAARLNKTKEFEKNYPVAGGVARVCFESPQAVSTKIDLALCACQENLPVALRKLQQLDDSLEGPSGGASIYPGLLAHFQPTSPHRNDAFLEVSSRYVEKKLATNVWNRSEDEIEKLMHDLLGFKQAHSFASLIWEPLFSKKVIKQTGRLIINDCKLDPKSEGPPVLLNEEVGNMHHFQFKNLEDVEMKCKVWFDSLEGTGIAMGKPVDYKFGAIDAILIKVANGACLLAGLQISFARIGYKPMECGVLTFAKLAESLKKAIPDGYSLSKEIWFLQPENGKGFNIEHLQAPCPRAPKRTKKAAKQQSVEGEVKQEEHAEAEETVEAEDETPKKKLQVRRRKLHIFSSKNFIVGVSKQVQQFGTVRFQDDAAFHPVDVKTQDGDGGTQQKMTLPVPKEPSLRPWKSTMAISNMLSKHLHKDFAHVIKEDLEYEHQALGSLKSIKPTKRSGIGKNPPGKRGRRSDMGKGRKYADQEAAIAEFVNGRWSAGIPTTRAEVYDVLRARDDCVEGTAFYNSYFAFGKEAGLASFLTRTLARINFSAQKNSIYPRPDEIEPELEDIKIEQENGGVGVVTVPAVEPAAEDEETMV